MSSRVYQYPNGTRLPKTDKRQSNTTDMHEPKADYQADRPRLRKMSTLDLLELYWVVGLSSNEIVNQTPYDSQGTVTKTLDARGIPVRDESDARQMQEGNINIDDLREQYLNHFQYVLVKELKVMREDRLMEEL
jgi:hypothetical protein